MKILVGSCSIEHSAATTKTAHRLQTMVSRCLAAHDIDPGHVAARHCARSSTSPVCISPALPPEPAAPFGAYDGVAFRVSAALQ
eukprot:4662176-Amphidinium_carterae.1